MGNSIPKMAKVRVLILNYLNYSQRNQFKKKTNVQAKIFLSNKYFGRHGKQAVW
jgi:hypothetical protein